jgi:hypothetical protein
VISILLLNYNYARFLPDALESIRGQTFRDFELIVADDGSTDESLAILERYGSMVNRVVTGPNVGLGFNILRALPFCTGEFLAITSADDRWLPHHLEVGLNALRTHPDAAISYSAIRSIDPSGELVGTSASLREPRYPSGLIKPAELLPGQFIPTQTSLFRRKAISAVGGPDPSLELLELDLIVRIAARFPVVFTGATTGEYRVHPGSMSRSSTRMLDARLQLYEKHFKADDSDTKRRFVAAAYLQTAYRELIDAPMIQDVRAARRHILKAFQTDPATMLRPLHIAMFVASLSDVAYARSYPNVRRWLDHSQLKIPLQRALGFRKGRLRFGRLS